MTFPISKFGQNLKVSSIIGLSQAAVGFGLGLLLADKMRPNTRQKTTIALLSAGTAAMIPFIAGIFNRVHYRPSSSRGMRRKLNSIRADVGSEIEEMV